MTKWHAEAVWFIGLALWYVIRHPYVRKSRRVPIARSFGDAVERTLLVIASCGYVLIPLVYALTGWPQPLERAHSPLLAILGALMLAAALWLFRRTHADLGRNWSVTLNIREGHQLVTSGVYRHVRHPMYSSFFVLGLAQALLLPNWFAGFTGLAGAALLYGLRVAKEEQMMTTQFGAEYERYSAVTSRIVPWVL